MGVCKSSNQIRNETEQNLNHLTESSINWEDLLFQLRHLEIRILELIYLPEPKPLAFNMLIQRTKKMGYSNRTIRRKIQKLETLNLIHVIRSTIMIINPILNLQKNIKTLTILWNHIDLNLLEWKRNKQVAGPQISK